MPRLSIFVAILLLLIIENSAHAESTLQNSINIEVTTHLGDKQTFQQGDVIFENNIIKGNTAGFHGGGIYILCGRYRICREYHTKK